MSPLAPALQAYFTDRLIGQRAASPNTIGAYKVTFRLLLAYAATHTRKAPGTLDIADLDATLVAAFWTTSNATGTTARPPATTAWPRCTRCSAIWPCSIPNTPPLSSVCSPSRPSGPNATSSTTSSTRGRRAVGHLRPNHLDRPARPRHVRSHHPDRPADLGTRRPLS